jgi:hypothetical protein
MISALTHYVLGGGLPLAAQARQACGLFGLCAANSLTDEIIVPIGSDSCRLKATLPANLA